MRSTKSLFILALFFFCCRGMAQADFEPNKADDLSRVNEQIKMLTEFKTCLQKASGMIALRDCHKNQKLRRKNLNKAQRKAMKERRLKAIKDRCTHRRLKQKKRNISFYE